MPVPSERDLVEWRFWATTVFIPNIRAMRDAIVSKADLLIESEMPTVLLELCAHLSGYSGIHCGHRSMKGEYPVGEKTSSDDVVMSAKAFLEGGPEDLPTRIVSVEPPGHEIKIAYRNGYEHFEPTPRQAETAEGPLPIYQWFERTKIAE